MQVQVTWSTKFVLVTLPVTRKICVLVSGVFSSVHIRQGTSERIMLVTLIDTMVWRWPAGKLQYLSCYLSVSNK